MGHKQGRPRTVIKDEMLLELEQGLTAGKSIMAVAKELDVNYMSLYYHAKKIQSKQGEEQRCLR